MSSDGIAGFKGSLETAFQKTQTQRCVVHLTRNIYKLCPKKSAKKIIAGWKKIYTSSSYEAAQIELEQFKKDFNEHKSVIKKVEDFPL